MKKNIIICFIIMALAVPVCARCWKDPGDIKAQITGTKRLSYSSRQNFLSVLGYIMNSGSANYPTLFVTYKCYNMSGQVVYCAPVVIRNLRAGEARKFETTTKAINAVVTTVKISMIQSCDK
jgi:hypothetical protein